MTTMELVHKKLVEMQRAERAAILSPVAIERRIGEAAERGGYSNRHGDLFVRGTPARPPVVFE